jgi:hypothetical protein
MFGFWRRVDMLVDADVSEKHTVSIFQAEMMFPRNVAFNQHSNTAPKSKK